MDIKTNDKNNGGESFYKEIAQALKEEGLGADSNPSSEQASNSQAGAETVSIQSKVALLTAKEAAEYLHVSLFTLSKMEKEGKLVPFRTPGGHRRYSLQMLNEYLERSRHAYLPTGSRPTKSD